MIIYGIGYMAVFLVFALLYIHAYRKRELLDLNVIEVHITREFIQRKFIYIAFGVVSIWLAVIAKGPVLGALSGWIYALIGPVIAIHAGQPDKQGRQKSIYASERGGLLFPTGLAYAVTTTATGNTAPDSGDEPGVKVSWAEAA